MFSHLNGQTTRGRCFTDTSFTADKDPFQSFLVNKILECWGKFAFYHFNNNTNS